eukprot:2511976-Rhodomonas_salina.8
MINHDQSINIMTSNSPSRRHRTARRSSKTVLSAGTTIRLRQYRTSRRLCIAQYKFISTRHFIAGA